MKKQLLVGTLAAAVMAGATTSAMADGLTASAGVASAYLWRGIDLGDGSAAVSGDIHYSAAGAYAGVWGSSGDSALGSEYDLYAGYGFEAGGLGIDLSVWNYNYSDDATGNSYRDDTTTEISDVILALSMGGVTFKAYNQVAGGSAEYYTLSYGMNGFTGLVGKHDQFGGAEDYTHLDLTYAYNSNLSFTVSKVLDDAENDDLVDDDNDILTPMVDVDDLGGDDDLLFVVSYTLPIM